MAFPACEVGAEWCVVADSLAGVSFVEFCVTVFLNQTYQVFQNYKFIKNYRDKTLIILYIQVLQTLCMCIHYLIIISALNVLYMIMIYFQFIEDTLVFYYFSWEAAKVENRGILYKRAGVILLAVNLVYLTGFVVFFGVDSMRNDDVFLCTDNVWIYLRISGLLLTTMFLVLGIKMTQKLKMLKNSDNLFFDTGREKELWGLILIMLIANTAAMFQNLMQRFYSQDNCNNLFDGSEGANIFLFILLRFLSQDMFMITCLYVFWAARRFGSNELSIVIDIKVSFPLHSQALTPKSDEVQVMSPLEWGIDSILSSAS